MSCYFNVSLNLNIMKKAVFAFLLSFIVVGSYGQFGLKAGTNTAKFKITSPNQTFQEAQEAIWGLNVGIFYRFKIAIIYFQPEAYFSSTGGKFTYSNLSSGLDEIHTLDMNRIDIPLLIGVKLGPIRVHGGPTAFFTISDKSNLENFDAAMKGTTWGYQAGLGIDLLKKLTFDARYEGSLSEISNNVTLPGGTTLEPSTKASAFLLSVGFMF